MKYRKDPLAASLAIQMELVDGKKSWFNASTDGQNLKF